MILWATLLLRQTLKDWRRGGGGGRGQGENINNLWIGWDWIGLKGFVLWFDPWILRMTLNFLISILVLFFFFLFKDKETLSPWWTYLGGPKTLLPTALTFHVCIKDSSFPSTHFTPSTCIYRHQQQFWISRDLTQSKARGGAGREGERERIKAWLEKKGPSLWRDLPGTTKWDCNKKKRGVKRQPVALLKDHW